jgi:DNA-binding transcriptional LysR family regulator
MIELRHLRTFVAVAEELSFTRASQSLRVSQSTVSKVVRELEAELGAELLERTTHEVRLTPAGAALLDGAGDALRAVTDAVAEAKAVAQGASGHVRVGFSPAVGPMDREDVVRALRPRGSTVSVALLEIRPGHLRPMLRRRELNIALGRAAAVRDPALERAELRPTPMLLAVSAAHPLSGRRSVALREVDGERLLVASAPGTPYTDLLLERARRAGAAVWPVESQVTGGAALLTQLLEEDAVSFVPAGTTPPSGVRCVPIRDLATPLWLMWPAGNASPAVDRLWRRLAPAVATDGSVGARRLGLA